MVKSSQRDANQSKKAYDERIKKIRERKPFTSATLDNKTPFTLENRSLFYRNPKKEEAERYLSMERERDNKLLIQKIGIILTNPNENMNAPETLPNHIKSPAERKEIERTIFENKRLLSRLNSLQPIYRVKDWEEDYQRQCALQDNLRMVKYKRPGAFVDPFRTSDASCRSESLGEDDSEMGTTPSLGSASTTSSRLDRVRSYMKKREMERELGRGAIREKKTQREGILLPPLSLASASVQPEVVSFSLTPVPNTDLGPALQPATGAWSGADFYDQNGFEEGQDTRGKEYPQKDGWKLNKVITQRRKSKDQDKDFVSVSLRRLSKELSTKLGFVDHSTHPSPASPYSLSDEQDEGYGGYGEDYSDGSFNEDGFNEDNIYDNADVNHRNHRERYTGLHHRVELTSMERQIRVCTVELEDIQVSVSGSEGSVQCSGSSVNMLKDFKQAKRAGESTHASTPRDSECRCFYNFRAKLECWVIEDRRTILIRARVFDSFPEIDVEAEVSFSDLATCRGLDIDVLKYDLQMENRNIQLESIAKELLYEAEITVEEKDNRDASGTSESLKETMDSDFYTHKGSRVVRLVVHLRARQETYIHLSQISMRPKLRRHSVSDDLEGGLSSFGHGSEKDDYSPEAVAAALARSSLPELTRQMMVTVTHTVPSRSVQMMNRKTSIASLNAKNKFLKSPAKRPNRHSIGTIELEPLEPNPGGARATFPSDESPSPRPNSNVSTPKTPSTPNKTPRSQSHDPRDSNFATVTRQVVSTNIAPLPLKPTIEHIPAEVTISGSAFSSDKVMVCVRFLEASKSNLYDKIAIVADTQVTVTIGLPSSMQADPELTLEFFENLLQGLSVEHDTNKNINECLIEMDTSHFR